MTTTKVDKRSQTADAHAIRLGEMGAICDTLSTYGEAEWNHSTYCDGWRVRDIVGHMLLGYTTPMPRLLGKVAANRFDIDRASARLSVVHGSEHTPAELLAGLREVHDRDIRRGISRVIPATEGVVDHVVHHLDITRPQGRPTSTAPEARRLALETIVGLGGLVRSKARAKGLRFEVTDDDWSWGQGPLVAGPSEDVLLALSGRPVGLDALSGDGVATLAARLS